MKSKSIAQPTRHGQPTSVSAPKIASGTSDDGFHFTKLFPNLTPLDITETAAREVGEQMVKEFDRPDSDIPAGYTYFGQFVDHDITLDKTPESEEQDDPSTDLIEPILDVDRLTQGRSPTLDLDSLYGELPSGNSVTRPDRVRFAFGKTEGSTGFGSNVAKDLDYDLLRGIGDDGETPVVFIPDDRNDENLAVGQMHALWMRFHNVVADKLEQQQPGIGAKALFEEARTLVIKHYQHIVLHDFISRCVDPDVFTLSVVQGMSEIFDVIPGERVGMPLEFSAAVYRFGHSLVRETYEWNRIFNAGNIGPATFGPRSSPFSLFGFTNSGGLTDENPLPTRWIVDWRHFFDFSGTGFDADGIEPQMAKSIDPYLSSGMKHVRADEKFNLATLNLRRSGSRGLPSAQKIIDQVPSVTPLTQVELTDGLDSELTSAIKKHGLDIKTPLWLYILQEANVVHGGSRLGALGSLILCETFVALIRKSEVSVLNTPWTPSDSPLRLGENIIDTLPKMIAWVDQEQPIINPIDDSRI